MRHLLASNLAIKSLFATANSRPLTKICSTAQSVGANVLNVQEKNLGLKPQGCASLPQPRRRIISLRPWSCTEFVLLHISRILTPLTTD